MGQRVVSKAASEPGRGRAKIAYETKQGVMLRGTLEQALRHQRLTGAVGKVDMIFTSPPFPLHRKKRYGNLTGEEYLEWLAELAPKLTALLAPTGSIIIEIGNAWVAGKPVMSTLPLESLLRFKAAADLELCQQFICHNPARIPGPAQWVNVERIRVKDSYTHVWWLSPTDRPKSNNRNVLVPYGDQMRALMRKQSYNAGVRPSGHRVSKEGFFKDNGGAIPPNVLEFSNTAWNKEYLAHCKELGIKPHPARMAPGLVEFFMNFLTEPGDLVFDPFAGSNTTGSVAERLERRWISVEPRKEYIQGSLGRFEDLRVGQP